MKPAIGRIVLYALSTPDAAAINSRRDDAAAFHHRVAGLRQALDDPAAPMTPGDLGRTGHVEHTGNRASEGDQCPAIIVRLFDPSVTTANLQVLLDGNDTYWATSRQEGDGPGFWAWPPQPEREPGDRPPRY